MAGTDWLGGVGRGKAGVARYGAEWRVEVRHGMAGTLTKGEIMSKKYVFKNTFVNVNIEADVVGNELDRIYEKHGALRPTDVVDEAKPDDAPLHPVFEWNDEVAGQNWRVHTARNLIRSVHVINENKEPSAVYVNIQTPEKQREYQPVEMVVNKPDMYAVAIYEAQQRINAAKKSLEQLQNAASGSEIDTNQMATIQIAMQALATASNAVQKLH
jgi:hypothetical protein